MVLIFQEKKGNAVLRHVQLVSNPGCGVHSQCELIAV